MKQKTFLLTIIFLFVGLLYRLILTSDNNFIFHMDAARDALDVREIVKLHKMRLIGPTSAIDGVFDGPAWYYFLAIPFWISRGNPYSPIILEMIIWLIGGFFLIKIVERYDLQAVILAGLLWIASDYVLLLTWYSTSPNLITLLGPLFFYLLEKAVKTKKLIFYLFFWSISGLFFNFEMNASLFIPLVIILALYVTGQVKQLLSKNFWLGIIPFFLLLLPQLIFELKHNFLMSQAMLSFLSRPSENKMLLLKAVSNSTAFYSVFSATFFNTKSLLLVLIILSVIRLILLLKTKQIFKDQLHLISLMTIMVFLIGYVLLPVNVNPWHLGLIVTSFILLSSSLIAWLGKINQDGLIVSTLIILWIFLITGKSVLANLQNQGGLTGNQSSLRNELKVIDTVYQRASGLNFKVYTYLPSVYDFPYQYLFWWYGAAKYSYLPKEYSYLPSVPPYISNKDKFNDTRRPRDSGLIFLIVEPESTIERLKFWESHFVKYPILENEMVGPIKVEVRKEG